jgi:hypothetical protein
MSRAFIKEVEPETIELPDRVVSSHPNLVTAEGLAAIERTGLPLLRDALAWFECQVVSEHPAGDHLLVLGKVRAPLKHRPETCRCFR